jgi:DNA-binding NtrC family response regulator
MGIQLAYKSSAETAEAGIISNDLYQSLTAGEWVSHMMKNYKDPHLMSPLSEVAAEAEKEHIMKVLKLTGGNKTKAAEILCISRKTLWEKLKVYCVLNDGDQPL